MKIKKIIWLSKEALEAEAIITDGTYELHCFAHPLTLTVGQDVKEIDALDAVNIVRSYDKIYKIEKLAGPFDYNLTGKLINKSKGLIKIGNIEITIGTCFPKDIEENEFLSLYTPRLDIE